MVEVTEYSQRYENAWSDFVERSSTSTVGHQLGWREVMRRGLGHRPIYLLALSGSEVKGILPLFKVTTWWRARYLISLPWIDYGGVCADSLEAEQALLAEACRLCDRERARFLELRSIIPVSSDLKMRQDKVTFLLPLISDSEKVWNSFDSKLKNLIRKSEKAGLTTEFGGIELLKSFYKVFSHNMRDLGTPVWGIDFFELMLKEFPDKAGFVLVRKDGEPVASGLVLAFKDKLYVPSASAYRSALKHSPNYALYWAVIKKGCEDGYKYFDFGRSSWDSNTFNFKKQWVKTPIQLNWQYYLPESRALPAINPSNRKYRFFISIWRRLPLPIANFLGPRVIRNFP